MLTPLMTERLVLRPFVMADRDWVARAMDDINVTQWIPLLPHPYTPADAEVFLTLQTSDKGDALAVEHQGKGIGCITTATELGYWFAQGAWGHGFATEAARAIAARYFEAGHDQMTSGYMRDNHRSRGVLEKLGFTPTETVMRRSNALGKDMTIQRMILTRQQWEVPS